MWTPDPSFMLAAIEESLSGAGRTHPNPSVGAAVVTGTIGISSAQKFVPSKTTEAK